MSSSSSGPVVHGPQPASPHGNPSSAESSKAVIGPAVQGPAPRPRPVNPGVAGSPTSVQTNKTDMFATREFWLYVSRRAAAGTVLGTVVGTGFGCVAAFEQIKLENPRARAAIKKAIRAGKSPADAVSAATTGAEAIIPSMENLMLHRRLVARTVGTTVGAFGGFLGLYWATTAGLNKYRYAGEPHMDSVGIAALAVGIPSMVASPVIRKNLAVLGFCVAMDAWHVFSEGRED